MFEAINAGQWERAGEYIATNAIDHTAPPGQAPGKEGWTQRWRTMAGALPDMQTRIEEMIEANGMVATRSRVTATPVKGFLGTTEGGRSFEVLAFDMIRVAGGQVVEHWGLGDFAAMVQQLGLKIIPAD